MYEHETPHVNLVISISALEYTSIWSIPKPFDIPLSSLSGQFRDGCHDSSKVFDKTFVKLCHPIFYYGFLGGGMFTIAYIFFGSGSFRSLEIIKPKIILENTMNARLSRFKLMPYFLHFWKHNMSFYIWLSMSLYTIDSSKNIFIKISKYSLNVLVTTL